MSNEALSSKSSAVAPADHEKQGGHRPGVGNEAKSFAAPSAVLRLREIIDRKSRERRLDAVSQSLFRSGVLALVALTVSTLLGWVTLYGGSGQQYWLQFLAGVQTTPGMLVLILSLGIGVFVGVSFLSKADFFLHSVYAAAGWGALSFLYGLWKIIELGFWAGAGLYIAVLASLAVVVAFGLLAIRLKRS